MRISLPAPLRRMVAPLVPSLSASGSPGYLVPAGTTFSQLLDFVGGAGDYGVTGLFSGSLAGATGRNTAVQFAAVYRCVSLISGVVAQLMCSGGLRVVGRDGLTVDNPETVRLVDLLTGMPDGYLPAYAWLEDALSDYLLDGNALILVTRDTRGRPTRLRRMSSWDADTYYGRQTGHMTYRLRAADDWSEEGYHDAQDVVHVRWGRMHRSGNYSGVGRRGFAVPVVAAMRPALEIGIKADEWVRNYFGSSRTGDVGGIKSKLAIGFEQQLTAEQRAEFLDYLRKYSQGQMPLIMGGSPKFTQLKETPQDADAKSLREYQVREVARVYGIPAPLVGEDTSNFGAGVETLAKLFYRFAARQHVARVLDAFGSRLLPPGLRFQVDESEILRGDSEAMAKFVVALAGSAQYDPVATQEELRHLVGLPRTGGPPPRPVSERPALPSPSPAEEPAMNLPSVFGGGTRLNGGPHVQNTP